MKKSCTSGLLVAVVFLSTGMAVFASESGASSAGFSSGARARTDVLQANHTRDDKHRYHRYWRHYLTQYRKYNRRHQRMMRQKMHRDDPWENNFLTPGKCFPGKNGEPGYCIN